MKSAATEDGLGESAPWFDPWLTAKGPALQSLVEDMAARIEANEPARKNRRSVKEQSAFMAAVDALVCNLALAVMQEASAAQRPFQPLLILLGAKHWSGRYSPPHIGPKTLRHVVDMAEDAGLLGLEKGLLPTNGAPRGSASSITPTAHFACEVERRGVAATADFGRRDGEEVIILRRRRADGTKEPVEYEDTAETKRLRKEVQRLNAFLAKADIAFVDDGQGPVNVLGARRLRRRFSLIESQDKPRFDQGGRLFGACWSNLARERRRESLRIDGEAIAEVDANALFTRLAYARLGRELGQADPYDAVAAQLSAAGSECRRAAIKKGVNAMFFGLKGPRWPREDEADMPPGLTVAKMRKAVLECLPELEAFISGPQKSALTTLALPPGLGFMFTESKIVLAALARLTKKGVVGLPLHDGILCAKSKAETVREAFAAAAMEVTGVLIPIAVK